MMDTMTDGKMLSMTLDHWTRKFRKACRISGKEKILATAKAAVALTRREMDAIKLLSPGMGDYEAWTEARGLYCITAKPLPELLQKDDEDDDE